MYLNLGNKGLSDFPRYMLSIGIVIASIAISGYFPIYLAIKNLNSNGIQIKDIENIPKYIGLNQYFIYLLIPFIAGFISLLMCIKYIHKRSIKSLFTLRDKFDWKRFFFSFSIWGLIMTLFLILSFGLGKPIVVNFHPETFFILSLISILILPIQTTFEEIFFRGYLFQGFAVLFKKGWLSVLMTSVLFGLMHGSNPEVEKLGMILLVFYILNGMFLGLVVLMDDGLELSMGYHAINNIFAALIVTNNWQAFHTDAFFIDNSAPEFGLENILTLVIIQPLLLFIFSKKYKWSSWKTRLFERN